MRIIVNGADGTMGKKLTGLIVSSAVHRLACAVDPAYPRDAAPPLARRLSDYAGEADCVIDFSHRSATGAVCEYSVRRGLPLVIATTGQTAAERELIASASEKIPVFLSANMSAGAALTARLTRVAASFFPDAEIEIVETHRSGKTDIPSGTALMLAGEISRVRPGSTVIAGRRRGPRRKGEIGIHSLRMGDAIGRHEVYVCAGAETVAVTHEAHDRLLFAQGALIAAEYLSKRIPGLYDMRNIADDI